MPMHLEEHQAREGEGMEHAEPAGLLPSLPQPRLPRSLTGGGRQDLACAAFHGTDALVVVLGADGRALLVNPTMTRATGWTEAELVRRPFWDVYVAPEDVDRAKVAFGRSILEGLAFPQEGDWLDHSGGRRRISMQNSVLRDEQGRPYAVVTVGVDVTDQRRHEAALRQRAETDPLTGLRNRGAFFEALTAELGDPSRTSSCGLLFCDLDGFKRANDEHGHGVGDLLLVEVARRLRAVTGVSDVVARLGGDEFVILCPGADEQRVDVLASRLEAEVSRPVLTPRGPVRLGVSVGTTVGRPGAHPDEVLRAADQRMYRVKSSRRTTRPQP